MQVHLFVRVLAWAALAAGLVLPTIAPATANIVVIALMALAIALCWRSPWRAILRQPGALLPLLAGALLLLAFAITARSGMHLIAVFYFAPLYLVGPLVALFDRLEARDVPTAIGGLALIGSIGAAAVAGYDAFVLGVPRAGISVNNPIHFADLALMLGFVTLTGLFGRLGRGRVIFLLGPVLAMISVILSGSRGPLLASVVMLATVLVLWIFWRLPRRHAWSAMGGGAVAAVVLLAVLLQTGLAHQVAALGDIATLLQTGSAPDSSTSQRLIMYRSAYNAFLASPIYGHGLVDFIAITAGYAPPGVVFPAYEHLHNDIADFSVVGGILGLCVYGLFIAAPLAGALRADHNRRAALMLGAALSIGYFTMGLTNAMFGVLSQTVLFAVGTALVVHLGRAGDVRGDPMKPASGNIHVVLAFDDNFWAPAYAVMRSICLNTTRRADLVFHLCEDRLSAAHRADLDRIASEFGVALRYYPLADNQHFNSVARSLPMDKRLHAVIYARLLLDLILPSQVERVIYLDCDTMVIGPIEQLWDADLKGMTLGAVPDAWKLLQTGGRDMTAKSGVFDTAAPYFNSGVLLIDLVKFAAAGVPARLADLSARGIIAKLYFDQDMLNLIFAGQWTALPWRFNVIDPRPPHQAMLPLVLHYTGKRRPWNLVSRTAFARLYRHVMTNELYYRFMRHRWKRSLGKLGRRLTGRR